MTMINEARKRLQGIVLQDQRVELDRRTLANEINQIIENIRSCETELHHKKVEIEEFQEHVDIERRTIEELNAELAKNEEEFSRLQKKLARISRKNKPFSDDDLLIHISASDEKLQLTKNMKLCLLRRCVGIVLDEHTSDKTISGFHVITSTLENFNIDATDERTSNKVELWKQISQSSPHFNEFAALFSQATIVQQQQQQPTTILK